ncbi:response regulator [Chlorobaculum thiosulfatiphilum]|uniref:response regulator n=1 Tax=Chlorobaculum thiosulfatiphilum TaxID=115852 RepID=UPI001FE34E79|nr:response regulator [Chlorobaculum thiosulfatiphilum]
MKELIRLKEYLKEGTLASHYNAIVVGLLGASAHFLFYFVYIYGFHLPYDNFWLRLIATCLCISLMFIHRLPSWFQLYSLYYWHFTLTFSLPFIFTVNLLMNGFNELWLYSEIAMVFILMMFVPNWVIFTLDLCTGVAAAVVFYLLSPHHIPLNPTFNIPVYSLVMAFSVFAGYIFSLSNWKSLQDMERQKAEEKYRALEALAGSIAHEMRNPLSQIRHNIDEVLHALPDINDEHTIAAAPASSIEIMTKRLNQAQMAVNRGLHVITMTLGNFRSTDVTNEELACLSAMTVTRKALEEYGYASEQERQMIRLHPGEDFIFLGEENSYILVIYNLMVNALQILHTVPGGRIDISLQRGETVNRILIRDNGPGISPKILPKIFDPFFTSGKKGGTGLGLAFCRRVMQSFKGQITCDSEEGKFTEFVLEFPALEQAAISKFESSLYAEYAPFFAGKKVLLAGIPEIYAPLLRRQLAPLKVGLGDADDSNKALEMIAANRYDLVLANASLPPDGAEKLANNIKSNGLDIPVIACSSSTSTTIDTHKNIDALISMPPALPELLGTLKSSLEMGRETLRESLSGKTVLVADDLDFNRRVIKLMLGKLGITILEASNGLEALELLKSHACDLLIIDMRMPVLDGFETAKRIRSTPSAWRDIPILGLSGNLDNASLKLAKESGINDSLIKPLKLKPFLQKVSAMLKLSQPR